MIVERALLTLKAGTNKADFAAAYALARPHIEGAKGFRKIEMRQGVENPGTYLLLVWWDSVDDHMKGFRESPAFAEWRKHLGPFFAGPPAVEHYEVTL
ncbi:MAG TPA: antibiotic biosynthesis monooxygenase [Rhizomicrobium sp.]|nr:antibiotic biosynthesis monooxygenase [Rhizomicrobium sp.]